MRFVDLKNAVGEIKQACEDNKRCGRRSPFFFLVGAGISYPPIPLALEIQENCKKRAIEFERTEEPSGEQPIDKYSHWFDRAYPQPEQRQRYLRDLMEKAFISRANFRLAHLLLDKTVTNLVVTTNFDDLLSRALSLFGSRHIVCDHPRTVERIDLEAKDVQIIHAHGTYWFYDCCNLKEEIAQRSQASADTSITMAALLDNIMSGHSPIVIGYSGWDGDVVTNAIKRRLSVGLRNNLYWFCYRRSDLTALPKWLAQSPNVCVVSPPHAKPASTKISEQPRSSDKTEPMSLTSDEKDIEPAWPATAVFDELIRAFRLDIPQLTRDPLGFFAEQLRKSLLESAPTELDSDVYAIRSVIERVERAKEQLAPASRIDSELEALRDLLRRSDNRSAVAKAITLPLDQLTETQLREVMGSIMEAASALSEDSPERLSSYELVARIADKLARSNESDFGVQTLIVDALFQKGRTLFRSGHNKEAIAAYDDLLRRFGSSSEPALQEKVAKALFNKSLSLGVLKRSDEEMATYDELLRRFGNSSEPGLQDPITRALLMKGFRLERSGLSEEAIAAYDEVLRRAHNSSEPALQERVAKALFNKGFCMGALKRSDEAIAAYDELLRRFGNSSEPALQAPVAGALFSKGATLGALERSEEAIASYDELLRRFGSSSEPTLQELVAKAQTPRNKLMSPKAKPTAVP